MDTDHSHEIQTTPTVHSDEHCHNEHGGVEDVPCHRKELVLFPTSCCYCYCLDSDLDDMESVKRTSVQDGGMSETGGDDAGYLEF